MALTVVTLPYNFTPNTLADANQVDLNFNAIVNYLNSLGAGLGNLANPGYIVLPGGFTINWGSVTVAADGSAATAVTFNAVFTSACWGVATGIQNAYQSNAWALTCQYDTPGKTGCNINVAGGPSGQNVTVFYIAFGV